MCVYEWCLNKKKVGRDIKTQMRLILVRDNYKSNLTVPENLFLAYMLVSFFTHHLIIQKN